MRRLALIVFAVLFTAGLSAAQSSAEPAPPADAAPPPCVQPVLRVPMKATADPANGAPLQYAIARSAIVTSTGNTITLKSDPSLARGVTITTIDGQITIVADRLISHKIAGTQQAFLYDRPGEACGLDLLPKELQPDA
jgi:hypothetical protein